MQLSRVQLLHEIGLTAWERRTGSRAADRPRDGDPRWELLLERERPSIAVVVESSPGFRYVTADPAAELLGKILGALETPSEAFAILRVDRADDCLAAVEMLLDAAPGRILLFGQPVGALSEPRLIQLPNLQAMLSDPGLKRPAWETLKPWVGRLA